MKLPYSLFVVLIATLSASQYTNAQTFIEATNMSFKGLYDASMVLADIDGDKDDDLFITGTDSQYVATARLYSNSNGLFSEVNEQPFKAIYNGGAAFEDIDNDGDLDLLAIGNAETEDNSAILYRNENGAFIEVANTPFKQGISGTVIFEDIDNDGDKDLFIIGKLSKLATMYNNDGQGNFTEVLETPFPGIYQSSVAFSDIDNDGDRDLLISGTTSAATPSTTLYVNDGQGNFSKIHNTPFAELFNGSITFSDIDNDGDEDVLITGMNKATQTETHLYTNEQGTFTEVLDAPFPNLKFSATVFADFDRDGDDDLFIVGEKLFGDRIAKLYTNDGSGVFTELMGTPFEGISHASIGITDVDNDGDEDIIVEGVNSSYEPIVTLYRNQTVTSVEDTEMASSHALRVYPNPSSHSRVTVDYTAQTSSSKIMLTVLDLRGRTMFTQQEQSNSGNNSFSIDTSQLPKGTYMVQITNGTQTETQHIVVQ
jgi:hypothetical protein